MATPQRSRKRLRLDDAGLDCALWGGLPVELVEGVLAHVNIAVLVCLLSLRGVDDLAVWMAVAARLLPVRMKSALGKGALARELMPWRCDTVEGAVHLMACLKATVEWDALRVALQQVVKALCGGGRHEIQLTCSLAAAFFQTATCGQKEYVAFDVGHQLSQRTARQRALFNVKEWAIAQLATASNLHDGLALYFGLAHFRGADPNGIDRTVLALLAQYSLEDVGLNSMERFGVQDCILRLDMSDSTHRAALETYWTVLGARWWPHIEPAIIKVYAAQAPDDIGYVLLSGFDGTFERRRNKFVEALWARAKADRDTSAASVLRKLWTALSDDALQDLGNTRYADSPYEATIAELYNHDPRDALIVPPKGRVRRALARKLIETGAIHGAPLLRLHSIVTHGRPGLTAGDP